MLSKWEIEKKNFVSKLKNSNVNSNKEALVSENIDFFDIEDAIVGDAMPTCQVSVKSIEI